MLLLGLARTQSSTKTTSGAGHIVVDAFENTNVPGDEGTSAGCRNH